jgi:hypothetical protein
MSCDTISVGILPPSGAILPASQFFGQTAQLPLIQEVAIDHSYNQLLYGAA